MTAAFRILGAGVLLMVAVTGPAGASMHGTFPEGEHEPFPYPRDEVPIFSMDADAGEGGLVVLSWRVQENASRYAVFVSPDPLEPQWAPVDGEPQVDAEGGDVQLTDESPPDPVEEESSIAYTVVAVDDEDTPVGQAFTATDLQSQDEIVPFPEEARGEPSTALRNIVAVLALAAIVGALFLLVWARRGR